MARLLKNWLTSYQELMAETEPAAIFDTWVGYSIIAAALRRKIYLQLGRLVYHSNIYVVLVAEPGIARKTRAIDFGVDFLKTIPELVLSGDSSTKEALTDDIESAALDALMDSGENLRHSSLSIISKEFESFLGQKKENNRMLTALTDLFDCPSDWTSRTRHSANNKIIRPWLNMLAATTPESLASSLPSTAVGGGLTSRIMFIWADKKKKSVAIPTMTVKDIELKECLEKDLYRISRLSGEYTMSPISIRKWTEWYNEYDEDESGQRICLDKSFSGWYARKPTYILKIAMLIAAAESDKLVIEWSHIEKSIEEIRKVELQMGNAFKAIGKSEISSEVDTVLQIIQNAKCIPEKDVQKMVWKDISLDKFDSVIETLRRMGKIVRAFKGPNGESGIWYFAA